MLLCSPALHRVLLSKFNVTLTGLPLLTTNGVHLLNTGLGLITSPPSSLAVSVYVG